MLLANEARRLTRALPPSSPTYRLEHLCGSSVLLLQSMQYSAVAAAYVPSKSRISSCSVCNNFLLLPLALPLYHCRC